MICYATAFKKGENINLPVLLIAYTSLFTLGFIDNSRGPLYPNILEHFQISTSVGAWFFSLASASGLVVNLSARWWMGYLGVLRSYKIFLFCMSFGAVLFGVSYYLSAGVLCLFAGSFIFGMGAAGVGIGINILTTSAVDLRMRGRALAGLHSMYALASVIAPLIISLVLGKGFLWNEWFLLSAVLPLAVFLFSVVSKAQDPGGEPNKEPIKAPISFGKRIHVGLIFSFYVAGEILLSTRLVFYLQGARGFEPEVARNVLSLFFFLLLIGRVLFIFIDLKGRNFHWLLISLVLSLCCFIAGLFISPWYFALNGLAMSWFFPVGMDWLTSQFEIGRDFMVASVFTTVGITLAILHFFFGILVDYIGAGQSFQLIGVLIFLSYLMLLMKGKSIESLA